MSSRLLDSLHIDHVSTIEKEEETDQLNPSKAVGPYSILVFALKLIQTNTRSNFQPFAINFQSFAIMWYSARLVIYGLVHSDN